ncbi:hypothetical protein QJS04_geneDACA021967 [Acorus gramineus]|uniref:Uncharacterized protein n=1 Tax=Acorus gramineus TaxID=55184 RepID=A0AAV9AB38_ACOGR|nr:hypothetical protein QJS04_geneDACA021967 [Acorus gramineus]
MKIAEIERRRLQMEEERKKKNRGITASNRPNQVAPQSQKRISELERLRLRLEEQKQSLGIDDVEVPLQEITESNRPIQAPPRTQRLMEIADPERLKLQLEDERKKNQSSNKKKEEQKPSSLKLNYTEIIDMWSDRGSIYIDGVGPQTVPVYETASVGADDVSFSFLSLLSFFFSF